MSRVKTIARLTTPFYVLMAASSLLIGQSNDPTDWPQFRGHRVDGVASASGALSEPFSLQVAWKVPLGSGYSGVSVAHGLAVTMFDDGESNTVIAFDSKTGEERWRYPLSPRYKGQDGSYDGPISTPLVLEDSTIALGPAGLLVALENEGGELRWSTHLVKDLGAPKPLYGFATSPILAAGKIILEIGGQAGAVAAFEPETGKLAWRLGTETVDYQNAILFERGGEDYVLAAGHQKIIGIDPGPGSILWEWAHGGGGARGVWSMVPVVAGPDRLFLAYHDDSSALFNLQGPPRQVTADLAWAERTIRNSYAVAVYHEGYIYAYSSRFLTCVDAATGKAVWKSRPPGDGFLILVDGHLVIQTKAGSVHVAKASPEGYQEVAQLDYFDGLSWTPPSFAEGSIFTRSLGALARVDIQAGVSTFPTDQVDATGLDDGLFSSFLSRVASSSDKTQVVDDFMRQQSEFPIIEEDGTVHFVYRGPNQDVAIAGDMIGARQEARMTRLEGTDLFYYSVRIDRAARLNYLFVPDYEFQTDPLNPRLTSTALFGKDMEPQNADNQVEMTMSWLAMPDWRSPDFLEDPPAGRPRGRLVQHQLHSEILGLDHTLTVYLPAGYDQSEERFPVVYMHGGLGALRRGKWPNSLDNLIGRSAAPVIVVFLEPVAGDIFDSRDKYGEFWAREVLPFVDQEFRTVAAPLGRAHAGGADAAHDALHCAFKYPGLSGKVAIQSLSMVDFGRKTLEQIVSPAPENPLEIYVEWGKYDMYNPQEAWDARQTSKDIAEYFRSQGYPVTSREVPDGTGWSSWKNRTEDILKFLFPITVSFPFVTGN